MRFRTDGFSEKFARLCENLSPRELNTLVNYALFLKWQRAREEAKRNLAEIFDSLCSADQRELLGMVEAALHISR